MPSNQPNEIEESNELSISFDDLPQPELSGHAWRQQGTALICESCPFSHASFIPPEYQLYGINEKGEPMIRPIKVQD
jgi:hypothetical protein